MTNSKNCTDLSNISYEKCLDLLQFTQNSGLINNIEDVLKNIEHMKNSEIIQQHPYKISQGSNGRWYTYLPYKENHTDGDRLQNLHKKQSIKPLSRIIKNEPQKNL